MKAYDWILAKQIEWAQGNGLELIGSEEKRGRQIYTKTLSANLFESLNKEAKEAFGSGHGNK